LVIITEYSIHLLEIGAPKSRLPIKTAPVLVLFLLTEYQMHYIIWFYKHKNHNKTH